MYCIPYVCISITLTTQERVAAIVSVCQSMHSVWSAKNKDAYRFDLNPAALACTCKGFRMTSICSHVLAGTVLLQNELDTEGTYGRPFLESLVEKLVTTKRGAHRPAQPAGGLQVQPAGDSEEEDTSEAEEGPDLDAF